MTRTLTILVPGLLALALALGQPRATRVDAAEPDAGPAATAAPHAGEQAGTPNILEPQRYLAIWTLVVFLAIIAVTCLATTTVGLLCSSLARRTAVAMVMTYLALLGLFGGPVAVGLFLQRFSTVSERTLAALTITSPFSAAHSVDLRPHSGWTGDSTANLESRPPTVPWIDVSAEVYGTGRPCATPKKSMHGTDTLGKAAPS